MPYNNVEKMGFDHGMIIGARQADLSISIPVDLLALSHMTASKVYLE